MKLQIIQFVYICCLFFSNPEYKDTPMDIAQLPHLPEKTSESSETSDSESDSKDNSGNTHGASLHPQKIHIKKATWLPLQSLILLKDCLISTTKSSKIKLKKTSIIF